MSLASGGCSLAGSSGAGSPALSDLFSSPYIASQATLTVDYRELHGAVLVRGDGAQRLGGRVTLTIYVDQKQAMCVQAGSMFHTAILPPHPLPAAPAGRHCCVTCAHTGAVGGHGGVWVPWPRGVWAARGGAGLHSGAQPAHCHQRSRLRGVQGGGGGAPVELAAAGLACSCMHLCNCLVQKACCDCGPTHGIRRTPQLCTNRP